MRVSALPRFRFTATTGLPAFLIFACFAVPVLVTGCGDQSVVRPTAPLDAGIKKWNELFDVSFPSDARLLAYSESSLQEPVWVVQHREPFEFSEQVTEAISPISAVGAILSQFEVDPQTVGTIQGETAVYRTWQQGHWDFRSHQVKTDKGLLTVIESYYGVVN